MYNACTLKIIVFSLLVTLTGCEWFKTPEDDPTRDLFPTEGVPYDVCFSDNLDGEIVSELKKASLLFRLEVRPPATQSALLKRAKEDQENFEKVLHSKGYFDAVVDFQIHDKKDLTRVEFKIESGPHYAIDDIHIEIIDNPDFSSHFTPALIQDIIGVHSGDSVDLEKIKESQRRVENYFKDHGFPFVVVKPVTGIVHKDSQSLTIVYPVETKNLACIKDTTIEGLSTLNEHFVRSRIAWKNGEIYNQKKVTHTQRKLLKSNVIANFQTTPELEIQSPLSANDVTQKNIMMKVKVTESPPRALGGGARYSTSEGIGGEVFWHHNNVRGNGEHFGISYRSSTREQRAKLSYDIPDLGGPEHKLGFETLWLRQKTRAYSGRTMTAGSAYEIPFNDAFKGSLGVFGEASKLYAQSTVFNSHLIGMPLEAKLDKTKDFFDPSDGARINADVTPYWGDLNKQRRGFVQSQGGFSFYIPFQKNELGESAMTLATFVKAGTIFIKDFDNTPPNKRFYGGGTGSIRSYGYQLVGPLSPDRTPLGGRSMAEWGTEMRFRTTERIGFVTFLEAATVTSKRIPELASNDTLYGGGLVFVILAIWALSAWMLVFHLNAEKMQQEKQLIPPFNFTLV